MARGNTASILIAILCVLLAVGWFAGAASASGAVVFVPVTRLGAGPAGSGWTEHGGSRWAHAQPARC